jgi:four helix bundle protein
MDDAPKGSEPVIRSFEDLLCWKSCRAVRVFAAGITRRLPPDERFRLTDQILRAARSTTANIAEGYGRFHYQENLQFCRQARGSLYETLDHFIAGHDEELIADADLARLRELFAHAVGLLNGYINYLDRAARTSRTITKRHDGSRVAEEPGVYATGEDAPGIDDDSPIPSDDSRATITDPRLTNND